MPAVEPREQHVELVEIAAKLSNRANCARDLHDRRGGNGPQLSDPFKGMPGNRALDGAQSAELVEP